MTAKRKSDGRMREVMITMLQLVFGLIGGALICGLWLAFKPVTILEKPPAPDREASDRHEVVYVRGKSPPRGAPASHRQRAFLDKTPDEHVLLEEDLNRWMGATYGKEERVATVDLLDLKLTTQAPVAHMSGEHLDLGVQVVAEREDTTRILVAQARGRFLSRGGHQVFVPRQVYLGSCPLPWNLGGRMVYQYFRDAFPVPDNVADAWAGVTVASVSDNRLRLQMRPAGEESVPASVNVPQPVMPAETPAPEEVEMEPGTPPAEVDSPEVPSDMKPDSGEVEPAPTDGDLPPDTATEPELQPEPESETATETTPPVPDEESIPSDGESAPPVDPPGVEPSEAEEGESPAPEDDLPGSEGESAESEGGSVASEEDPVPSPAVP